jgi:hypothetical protein
MSNECRQRSDPADVNYPQLEAFPEGFRMLAGDPALRSFSDTVQQNAVSFACLGTNTAQTNGFPNIKCPDGLRAQIFFPSCWNGVDLDSADHKSHVVYPSGTDVSFMSNLFPLKVLVSAMDSLPANITVFKSPRCVSQSPKNLSISLYLLLIS